MSQEKGNKNFPDKGKNEGKQGPDKPLHDKRNWDIEKGYTENKSPKKEDKGISDIGPQKNDKGGK